MRATRPAGDGDTGDGKVLVPPVKTQGIKTRSIPAIRSVVERDEGGLWVEPFVGSCCVPLNMRPKRALLGDANGHLIDLYEAIQRHEATPSSVRDFLEEHGARLAERGAGYYYEMRDAFNGDGDPLKFLFLNRSGFNGLVRFNRRGELNVPFCKRPSRFSKAYITKVCNQVAALSEAIDACDWEFVRAPWQDVLAEAGEGDYAYLDPPYVGRDVSYVAGGWDEAEAVALAEAAHATPAEVCLSMWESNEFRRNEHLYDYWSDFEWTRVEHFYHVGAREANRHPMAEVLAIRR